MIRACALALALPLSLAAQIQLFVFDGATEKPAAALTDLGNVPSGDTREVRFRVRNTGAGPASVTVTVSGQGFALYGAPLMPVLVAPANFAEFRVRFSAILTSSYSGTFAAGTAFTLLRATVVPGAAVSIEDNALGQLLDGGATLDFGRVKRGQSASRDLRIANGSNAPLVLDRCSVSGAGFTMTGIACPYTIPAAASVAARVTFEAREAVDYRGTLYVGGREFGLAGSGFEPPLPRPSVSVDAPLASGLQRKLAVRLAQVSETSGSGTVTLSFTSADPNYPDDPAVRFTTGQNRVAFQVKEGDSIGTFGTGPDVTFQTGTTAGALTFTVALGGYSEVFTFPVAAAPPSVDTASLSRRPGVVDVAVTAFDNTRTAGKFTFTFYDAGGRVIQPGAIRADWTDAFVNYFRNTKSGGSFAMRAAFPVGGDPASIGAVEVEIVNSQGTARTQRIPMAGVLP